MKKNNIRISRNEKLSFISNLATLIASGIPILSAIESLSEDTKGNIKKMLDKIYENLLAGKQLNETFAEFPNIFNKIEVSVIKSAEEAGNLEITLKDMKVQLAKDIEFSNKVRTALAYPALVIVIFIGLMLLILTVVIPKISLVFKNLKVSMPLPTKVLIFASDLVLKQTLLIAAILFIIILSLFFLYRTKKNKLLSFFYKFPVISNLVSEIDLMKFSKTLHLLLSSGITITSALSLTESIVVKPEIAKAIAYSRDNVLAGKDLTSGFKNKKKIFPTVMIKLTEAGERTGTLDTSMKEISEYFEAQVEQRLKTIITLLEPVMLVVVGVLVGAMMLAIIAPIYNLIGQISPR